MIDIKIDLDDQHRGAFYVVDNGAEIGEMDIAVNGGNLTVYHTEVAGEAEGKGYAKKMLDAMAGYAREQHLKVVPLCPFVKVQFERHPADYADIWKK